MSLICLSPFTKDSRVLRYKTKIYFFLTGASLFKLQNAFLQTKDKIQAWCALHALPRACYEVIVSYRSRPSTCSTELSSPLSAQHCLVIILPASHTLHFHFDSSTPSPSMPPRAQPLTSIFLLQTQSNVQISRRLSSSRLFLPDGNAHFIVPAPPLTLPSAWDCTAMIDAFCDGC